MPSVAVSSSKKSRSSPNPTSIPPPNEMTVEKPMRSGAAKSSIAALTAPDCATSASRPGSAAGAQYVAFNPMSVRITPRAPGPTRRTSRFRATAATLRFQACAVALSLASGAVIRIAARRPSRAPSSMTAATVAGGVAMIARSTGRPIAVNVGSASRARILR
jgi:hypothetical protein